MPPLSNGYSKSLLRERFQGIIFDYLSEMQFKQKVLFEMK